MDLSLKALEKGAILLLDEIDLASNKILCLQSILEGKGIFLKKIGKYIQPKDGFNVIATANTKGKGNQMTVALLEPMCLMKHS